ncbi:MAG: hypothetical protein KAS02_00710 [Candidatus Pacebacteria bacterium]|nr:hypothetical protein [Candidatus Paceibacterota bacterium]
MFLNKENLHHAYLLEGERDLILPDLLFFLEKELNFQISSNPDLYLRDFVTFGIDDGKIIKDFQSKKPVVGNKQVIIIQTNFITNEAQNSLLKMFEEPTKDVHIFLIIQSSENLLATLKSRLQIIKFENDSVDKEDLVIEFLKSNLSKRFDLIKEFLPKTTKDKADKVGAIQFLNSLEKTLHKKFSDKKEDFLDFENIFIEISKCRSYLNDRSPSVKMILEHISQIIPIN